MVLKFSGRLEVSDMAYTTVGRRQPAGTNNFKCHLIQVSGMVTHPRTERAGLCLTSEHLIIFSLTDCMSRQNDRKPFKFKRYYICILHLRYRKKCKIPSCSLLITLQAALRRLCKRLRSCYYILLG